MPINRTIYNVQGLFLAPYSGESGPFNFSNTRVLKRMEKINSVDYSISEDRLNLSAFGIKSSVFRGAPNAPQAQLDFSYIPDGFTNESRLNFDVAHFSGNNSRMFSGLFTNSEFLNKRDFYLVINENGTDLFSPQAFSASTLNPSNINQIIDQKSLSYSVIHFQNCYIKNYSFSCSVGAISRVTQSYDCDNFIYYSSGSGIQYTTLDTKTGENVKAKDNILIPYSINYYDSKISGQNILLPKNASLSFNGSTRTGVNFYSEDIQAFSFGLNFRRREQRRINNVFPISRRLIFPLQGKVTFSLLASKLLSGSLVDSLNKDEDYNILINFVSDKIGVDNTSIGITGCRFLELSYDSNIGDNKTASLGFEFEVDPDFGRKGIFASGNILYGITGSTNVKKELVF